jgi:hypothetical protein
MRKTSTLRIRGWWVPEGKKQLRECMIQTERTDLPRVTCSCRVAEWALPLKSPCWLAPKPLSQSDERLAPSALCRLESLHSDHPSKWQLVCPGFSIIIGVRTREPQNQEVETVPLGRWDGEDMVSHQH